MSIYQLIYDHDFAQALWGDGLACDYCGEPKRNMHPSRCPLAPGLLLPVWQHHLQQMVIADEPIAYLGDHL